jgi:threonine aldolase
MGTIQRVSSFVGFIDRSIMNVYGGFSELPNHYFSEASSSYLRKFEAEIAKDFGKEDAVFMPSGVMAQNIALLIHSKKEHLSDADRKVYDMRFACHHSSHLLLWEEDSYSKLVELRAVEIDTKSKGEGIEIPAMKMQDVESVFKREMKGYDDGMALVETGLSTLIIELPHRELGGRLTPWEDVISIGELCKKNGVKYHCDGARIFEASAGYG